MNVYDKDGNMVGTKGYMSDLDTDQLLFCIEHANELLAKKRNEVKKTIWQVVEDRSLVVACFREDEYLMAVKCLAKTAEAEFANGEQNHYSIESIRVPASEYEDYFS